MKKHVSRRFVLGGALSTLACPVFAEAPSVSLRPRVRALGGAKQAAGAADALIGQSGLSGQVSFMVADAKTGLRLEGHEAATGIPPASVAKAITALYALDVLGPDYQFRTRIMAAGTVKNGVLHGDLVLVGGGDPTLDTNALAGMARDLKASGLREVRGAFKVYDGALPYVQTIDPEQPDHVGYSPAVSGIALNFNRVHFEWKRGAKGYGITMDARSDKYRPDVAVARMRVADRSLPVYTYKKSGDVDDWSVAKGALGKGGARWLPVRNPALYAADVFRTMAGANGIPLKSGEAVGALPAGTVLVTHQSEKLRDILQDMLKYSTNLTAEMIGMSATAALSGKPASLKASAREMNRWAGGALNMKTVSFVDHSGLGGASRVSANDMVEAMVQVHARKGLRPILKSIALRDSKGRATKDHPIEVDAKTGTLNFVSGLAGYMTAADGTELVFAIFAADQTRRARIKPEDRESPDGARSWNTRAKTLQQALIERWGLVYGT